MGKKLNIPDITVTPNPMVERAMGRFLGESTIKPAKGKLYTTPKKMIRDIDRIMKLLRNGDTAGAKIMTQKFYENCIDTVQSMKGRYISPRWLYEVNNIALHNIKNSVWLYIQPENIKPSMIETMLETLLYVKTELRIIDCLTKFKPEKIAEFKNLNDLRITKRLAGVLKEDVLLVRSCFNNLKKSMNSGSTNEFLDIMKILLLRPKKTIPAKSAETIKGRKSGTDRRLRNSRNEIYDTPAQRKPQKTSTPRSKGSARTHEVTQGRLNEAKERMRLEGKPGPEKVKIEVPRFRY